MIIWLNGGFGAGKTTLAEELHRRLPDAILYDPEYVGVMLRRWMRPNGDFQDLPSWRELVVATALSLRRHHADTLIVPMTLIRDGYRTEILGSLADAGQEVLHVFLEVEADTLRQRLKTRVVAPGNPEADQAARAFCLSHVDAAVAAAARQPAGTLRLRPDRLTPAELADKVMAAASAGSASCARKICCNPCSICCNPLLAKYIHVVGYPPLVWELISSLSVLIGWCLASLWSVAEVS